MRALIVLLVVSLPLAAIADEVHLKSGGKLEGVVKSKGDKVVIETATGEITLSADQVASIDEAHTSKLEEIYAKADAVKSSKDARDFLGVACFAKEHKASRHVAQQVERAAALVRTVREPKDVSAAAEAFSGRLGADLKPIWEHLLTLAPDHETARRELGYRRHGDKWLTEEEFQAAMGNVKFEGRWISTSERDAILKERAAKLDERIRSVESRERKIEAAEMAAAKAKAEAEAQRRQNEDARRALDKERKEVEDQEKRVRAKEASLNELLACATCGGWYRQGLAHVCPTVWTYCKTCDGYFKTGHAKHLPK